MLKRITLLGLLALFMFSFTAEAGDYKGKFTKDIPENDPLRADSEKDCLTDAEATQLLESYFGITVTATPQPGTTGNEGTYSGKEPTGISAGEVVIVEVNDHWIGSKKDTNGEVSKALSSTPFDQIKFGVKKVTKVANSVKIPSGTIYGINLTTNRYFFAKRRATKKSTEPFSDFPYLALRWYDEWSTIKSTANGWNELGSSYTELQNGDPQPAPHNCDTSLELNHFTVLNKEATGTTEAITTFLYIPDGIGDQKDVPEADAPYQFFYRGFLNGDLKPSGNAANPTAYDAHLDWNTSFDKCQAKYPNTKYYDKDYANGIREFYTLVKVDENGDTTHLLHNQTTLDQVHIDKNLPVKKVGYDVTYYVISNVCMVGAVGADGKVPQGKQLATVTTNIITLHIPGTEEFFDLKIDGNGTATYLPSGIYGTSMNRFTNSVSGVANSRTPELAVGDVLELYRTIDGQKKLLQRLEITDSYYGFISQANRYKYKMVTYLPDGQTKNSNIDGFLEGVLKNEVIATASSYSDVFDAPAGMKKDATYQLELVRPGETNPYKSNIVNIPSYRALVSVVAKHRSGVPDAATCDPKEITHNEISFKPIINGNIEAYYIYRDTKPIARITQPTDASGTKYAVTLPDANGKFNIKADPINVDTETNQLTYTDLAASETPINETEDPAVSVSRKDHFYTVVISLTDGKSTYGNNDVQPEYLGGLDELVINAYCDEAEFGFWAWDGRFTSHLRWEKNWNEVSDVELGKLLGYEIYYKEVNGKAYKRLTHETNFTEKTEKRNGKDVLVGYTTSKGKKIVLDANTTTFVDDYFWDGNGKTEWGMPGFITTPREYYVKAIFSKDQTVLKNIREKNSNRIKPDGNGVTTMVEGIEAPVNEVTVYPNPATEYAVVRATNGINNVTVYNLTGAAVMNIAGNGESEMTLDVSALAAGTYFVAVNGEKPEKLIVR